MCSDPNVSYPGTTASGSSSIDTSDAAKYSNMVNGFTSGTGTTAVTVPGLPDVMADVDTLLDSIESELSSMLQPECIALEGMWSDNPTYVSGKTDLANFYSKIYGKAPVTTGTTPSTDDVSVALRGRCYENAGLVQCQAQDALTGDKGYAQWVAAASTCELKDGWYEYRCKESLHGFWDGSSCYID
jgi:hypothetical protein